MRLLAALALVVSVQTVARADETTTTRHLLAGVRAFKAQRYEEALVELRVVARAADAPADLAFYLGPTLYKLGRYTDAITVFVSSRAERDALSDFYLGESYYQAKLYRKARQTFASLRTRGLGPALDDAAARYVAAVDVAYKVQPQTATIDVYLAQAAELVAQYPVAAGEILDEARLVEALSPVRHRRAEILAALGAAWNAGGRARAVIAALADEQGMSANARWQLARAYASVGETVRARPLLEALAADKTGAHAAEAAALLGSSSR